MTARLAAAAALLLGTGVATRAAAQALPAVAEVVNGRAEVVTYRGVRGVKLVPAPATAGKDEDMLALLHGPEFRDGTIQLDVSGAPRPGAPPDSRGFIGISVRTGAHGEWSEVFFPWYRLRKESPGVYESYADMEAGAWTTMRIEVAGRTARLYVNGAAQPCLIVNDLKQGDRSGRIALWAHVETDAYFGPITVTTR